MSKQKKFKRLLDLPDDESYAEFLKLSPDEQREYEQYAKAQAEHYKRLTMDGEGKLKELEEQIKQKDEEYKRLKGLH
ncbi:MAG: hypothetical protein ABW166_09600 [Sedimenticola sp.]